MLAATVMSDLPTCRPHAHVDTHTPAARTECIWKCRATSADRRGEQLRRFSSSTTTELEPEGITDAHGPSLELNLDNTG